MKLAAVNVYLRMFHMANEIPQSVSQNDASKDVIRYLKAYFENSVQRNKIGKILERENSR